MLKNALSWFGGLKIWAIVGAIFLAMIGIIKNLMSKNKELEHENKINDQVSEIGEDQEVFEQEILKDEPERINQKIKANSGKSRRNRASGL